MTKKKEEKQKVLIMPETEIPKISESLFEPDKNHSLIFIKLVSMNQPCLANNSHQIDKVINAPDCPAFLLYGNIQDLREYLHGVVDLFVDGAAEAAKLNP